MLSKVQSPMSKVRSLASTFQGRVGSTSELGLCRETSLFPKTLDFRLWTLD